MSNEIKKCVVCGRELRECDIVISAINDQHIGRCCMLHDNYEKPVRFDILDIKDNQVPYTAESASYNEEILELALNMIAGEVEKTQGNLDKCKTLMEGFYNEAMELYADACLYDPEMVLECLKEVGAGETEEIKELIEKSEYSLETHNEALAAIKKVAKKYELIELALYNDTIGTLLYKDVLDEHCYVKLTKDDRYDVYGLYNWCLVEYVESGKWNFLTPENAKIWYQRQMENIHCHIAFRCMLDRTYREKMFEHIKSTCKEADILKNLEHIEVSMRNNVSKEKMMECCMNLSELFDKVPVIEVLELKLA